MKKILRLSLNLAVSLEKVLENNSFEIKFNQELPFSPNENQVQAIQRLKQFLLSKSGTDLFVLKGYAGTGKTSLVSAFARILPNFKWKSVLLAPTGRAAKVLSLYSKIPAHTIHKKIFNKTQTETGGFRFSVAQNLHTNTVFIVDEASMIAYDTNSQNNFATPGLLESLFEYVYSGYNCKLLLIGDGAQLPPVGSEDSPALNLKFLKSAFHLTIFGIELTMVARQSLESGILANATELRNSLLNFNGQFPKFKLTNDVIRLSGDELEDALNTNYGKYSFKEVLIITRSNKRANLFNQAVRSRVKYLEDDVAAGDLLMVVKNNYFWIDEKSDMGFIANGDSFEIKKIINREELYGFNFLDCIIDFTDYPELIETRVKLIQESLYAEGPSITVDQQKQLYNNVLDDVMDEPIKGKRIAYLKQSEHYNSIQSKFSYAVTCHKAQGGQWPVVFIDQGYLNKDQIDVNFLRWLYTALTRAKEKVYLINFSDDFFE